MSQETMATAMPPPAMLQAIKKEESVPEISPRTGKPKRRKAIRACIHCQRTHLTCDNNRPCERCVSRGLAATCKDGTRKKAKYLGNDDERRASAKANTQRRTSQPTTSQNTPLGVPPAPLPGPHAPIAPSTTDLVSNQMIPQHVLMSVPPAVPDVLPEFNIPTVPANVPTNHRKFQSSIADHEYNVLSTILAVDKSDSSPSFSEESHTPMYGAAAHTDFTLENMNFGELFVQENSPLQDWLEPPKPPPISLTINQQGDTGLPTSQLKTNPAMVYQLVRKPFPYTPGFHALFEYLKGRFQKRELMDIVRSMSKYRPTFIAYSSSLTEDDLVFLEQCFQRSLLEYEKYFALSGTPTIIWRRTGQIAAVGPEFCMLTGYQMQDLVVDQSSGNPGRFIVELMDDKSAVDYFQKFSQNAFGDSRGVTMCDCTLITKQGKPVLTSSVLTLKRDMFGIPMLIVGNFLPILTK